MAAPLGVESWLGRGEADSPAFSAPPQSSVLQCGVWLTFPGAGPRARLPSVLGWLCAWPWFWPPSVSMRPQPWARSPRVQEEPGGPQRFVVKGLGNPGEAKVEYICCRTSQSLSCVQEHREFS